MGLAQTQPPTRTNDFQGGQAAVGPFVNQEFDRVYGVLNGSLSDQNLASNAGISGSKIANISIPALAHVANSLSDAQIAAGGITGASLAVSAAKSQNVGITMANVKMTAVAFTGNSSVAIDIPTATTTFTVAYAANMFITYTVDMTGGIAGDTIVGNLVIDGLQIGPQVIFTVPNGLSGFYPRNTLTQSYVAPLIIGSHIVKLQIYRSSGSGNFTIQPGHTNFSYFLSAQ